MLMLIACRLFNHDADFHAVVIRFKVVAASPPPMILVCTTVLWSQVNALEHICVVSNSRSLIITLSRTRSTAALQAPAAHATAAVLRKLADMLTEGATLLCASSKHDSQHSTAEERELSIGHGSVAMSFNDVLSDTTP